MAESESSSLRMRKEPEDSEAPPSQDSAASTAAKCSHNSTHRCVHEVVVPTGYVSSKDKAVHGTLANPVFKGEMAKTYAFSLDPLQKVSVTCLQCNESVLVSAHTSAGKTAVAEYAIAMAFRDRQRVSTLRH